MNWWIPASFGEWLGGWFVLAVGYLAWEIVKARRRKHPKPYTGRRYDGPQTGTVTDDPHGQPKEHTP